MKRSEAEWEQVHHDLNNNISGVAGGRHRAAFSRNILSTPKQQYSSIPAVNCKPTKVMGAKKAKLADGCRGTSGSDDQSDDNDDELFEFENELSDPNIIDIKRMRRMISNRESARRSRTRKQAQQIDLELQVDQLRGESAALYKQFTDANHQFTVAVNDNRVLKSNVEAIRMKVKMAEDMLTRGSLPCSLDIVDMNIMDQIQENGGCIGNFQGGDMGVGMNAGFDHNLQSVISSEITSCETDVWSWGSPTADVISKLQII